MQEDANQQDATPQDATPQDATPQDAGRQDAADVGSAARLIGVLHEPTKTFRAIGARPTWGLALVVLLVISIVLTFLVAERINWTEFAQQSIADSGRELTPEQTEKQIEIVEKFGSVMAWIGPIVMLLGFGVMTLVFWLGLKVMSGELSFKQSFSVVLHGMAPYWLVSSLLSLPIVLGKGEIGPDELEKGGYLMSNAAFLAPEGASKALVSLLSSLDLFSFWSLALLTVGLSTVGKVSKAKAAIVAVGLWVVYVGGKTGLALLGQMAGG